MFIVTEYLLENQCVFICIREYLCPECKEGNLIFHDYCKRIVRHEDGESEWIRIPRHQCDNPRCRKLHRMLPDFLVPFKHYLEDVISDAINDRLNLELIDEAPSPATIRRWKRWILINQTDIDGQLKSVGHRELDYSEELLKSGVSLLKKLMCSIPCGWLRTILCMIFNSGGRLIPVYA